METYQIAWAAYVVGALGCGWATWLLFRRLGREWGHFFMVSVWAVLLTPYAMKVEPMVMAPALFILVMETLINGFASAKPIAILLAGVWLVALILSLIYQLLTRGFVKNEEPVDYQDYDTVVAEGRKTRRQPRDYQDNLSHDEYQARDELLAGERPMRAER